LPFILVSPTQARGIWASGLHKKKFALRFFDEPYFYLRCMPQIGGLLCNTLKGGWLASFLLGDS
jgi:hypothetical protein